jgi:hypothetical protein
MRHLPVVFGRTLECPTSPYDLVNLALPAFHADVSVPFRAAPGVAGSLPAFPPTSVRYTPDRNQRK